MPVAPASLVLPGRFRAAVFDMDGLLLDTEPMWHDAERELLERHGDTLHRRGPGGVARTRARRTRPRRTRSGSGLPADAIEREIGEIMLAHYVAGAPLHAGARELVDALAGRVALAVASNTSAALVRRALDAVGLSALRVVVSGMDSGGRSRCRTSTLEACRALGVAPADAIAFEDSPMGVRSAVAAGLFVVGVPERPDVDLAAAGAHVVLGSLAR